MSHEKGKVTVLQLSTLLKQVLITFHFFSRNSFERFFSVLVMEQEPFPFKSPYLFEYAIIFLDLFHHFSSYSLFYCRIIFLFLYGLHYTTRSSRFRGSTEFNVFLF